jgi:hypothetical protein
LLNTPVPQWSLEHAQKCPHSVARVGSRAIFIHLRSLSGCRVLACSQKLDSEKHHPRPNPPIYISAYVIHLVQLFPPFAHFSCDSPHIHSACPLSTAIEGRDFHRLVTPEVFLGHPKGQESTGSTETQSGLTPFSGPNRQVCTYFCLQGNPADIHHPLCNSPRFIPRASHPLCYPRWEKRPKVEIFLMHPSPYWTWGRQGYIGQRGISLSGSYQQGYSTAYNTQLHIKVVCNGYILTHILNCNSQGNP